MQTSGANHQKMCIAGVQVDGDTGKLIEVINPFTDEVVGTVPRASRKQVADAFAEAASYRPQLSRYQRQQILSKTAQLLTVAKDRFSDLITFTGSVPVGKQQIERLLHTSRRYQGTSPPVSRCKDWSLCLSADEPN